MVEIIKYRCPGLLLNKKGLGRGRGAGGERDNRGWDGWMASPTRWTWVWVNSWSWWGTGRPGVLQFMGSQRVWHNCATELNWTEYPWTLKEVQFPWKCGQGDVNLLRNWSNEKPTYFCLCDMLIPLRKVSSCSLKFMSIGYVLICKLCKLSWGLVTVRPNVK